MLSEILRCLDWHHTVLQIIAGQYDSMYHMLSHQRNACRCCSLNSRTTRQSQYVEKEQYHKRIGRKQLRVRNNPSPNPSVQPTQSKLEKESET